MALRVLSGMVFIPRGGIQRGSMEIGFNPFDVIAASNAVFELRKKREIGAAVRFRRPPASIVAVRQFALSMNSEYRVNINDRVTRNSITISWSARTPRVDQEEIPFMVIGEIPDPVKFVQLPPGTTLLETLPQLTVRRRSGRRRPQARKRKKAR